MNDLILFQRDGFSVSAIDAAKELEMDCLAAASLIGRVRNADENRAAVEVQAKLDDYLKAVEKSRKFVKQPFWDASQKIDELARAASRSVLEEMTRISRHIGDYQALEQQKLRAAEAARLRDLAELERKRQQELAQAKSLEQADLIQEKFHEHAAALPVPEPTLAPGQNVKDDWELEYTSLQELAKHHPDCCRIEPLPGAIKDRLNKGLPVHGVIGRKIVKATVRKRRTKEITV